MPSGVFTLKQVDLAITQGAWTNQPPISVNYLVVAGGGAGAYQGAGGAGGLLQGTFGITAGTSYTVTVGSGGAGAAGGAKGSDGSNSVFGPISAFGGGAGGGTPAGTTSNGNSGGSGGGSADSGTPIGIGGQGTAGQGNRGGNAATTGASGGGGGAGTPGLNGVSSSICGNGGAGVASDISGVRTVYAGGGGGGPYSTNTAGKGGAGGGGDGGTSGTNSAGQNGSANTGGGAGGSAYNNAHVTAASGGSGIVIVSYPGTTQWFTGGTLSYGNGNIVHSFYSSGTLAPTTPSTYVDTGYQISRSLRFNSADSAYLSRTPAGAGNRTTWTFSGWAKLGALSTSRVLFSAITGSNETTLYFDGSNRIDFYDYASSAYTGRLQTTQVFRDPSAWYHIVAVWNSASATAGDRMRLYINGVEVTAFGIDTNPAQNTNSVWNQAIEHRLGGYSLSSIPWDGYMTEVNFIDGQALTPQSFGYYNPDTGVWSPLKFVGTYGTNGFYLNFSDNSNTTAATLGKDYSGNGNNWTPNNFSVTAGAGNDSLVDSPTAYGTDTGAGGTVRGNYCTLNPLGIASTKPTFSNGNLEGAAVDGSWSPMQGTTGVSAEKWYWEVTVTGRNDLFVGIARTDTLFQTLNPQNISGTIVYFMQGGNKRVDGTDSAYGAGCSVGDVIGVALDLTANTVTFYRNNTSQGAISLSGTTLNGQTIVPFNVVAVAATVAVCNFGQRPFAYTAPSGFKALCTQNLPTPTIGATTATQAGKYFDVVLRTSNGSAGGTYSTTVNMSNGALLWDKARSINSAHYLLDSVRGISKTLSSNTTGAEASYPSWFTNFGTSSFTTGPDDYTAGTTVVDWIWAANGSGVTNTAGFITSTVSANTTSGFSVVTYTGNGTGTAANGTVGHGLGVVPSMIIIKRRNSSGFWWVATRDGGTSTSPTYSWFTRGSSGLNDTGAAFGTGQTFASSGYITSTTFNVYWLNAAVSAGDSYDINFNTGTYVAYCFAEVPGYSRFGSFVGNGSADGPFVYCGFRPRWIMYKDASASYSWVIVDTARQNYNVMGPYLLPNSSDAEGTTTIFDILSNGFKVRVAGPNSINTSGDTIVFAAFAESPFKYSIAR